MKAEIILHVSDPRAAIQIQCNNVVAIKSKHPENLKSQNTCIYRCIKSEFMTVNI